MNNPEIAATRRLGCEESSRHFPQPTCDICPCVPQRYSAIIAEAETARSAGFLFHFGMELEVAGSKFFETNILPASC
jgi:hypothetical protein